MFPDLEGDSIGGAVGIIIPDTVTETDREIFESLLTENTTSFKTQVGAAHVVEVEGSDDCIRRRWKLSMQSIRSFLALWQQEWLKVSLKHSLHASFYMHRVQTVSRLNTLSHTDTFPGAEVVGRGMVKGAVKTSEYLFYGSEYAKQYITPEATAREVDPKVRQGLEAARYGIVEDG